MMNRYQEWLDCDMLRNSGEKCICKRGGWLHGCDWNNEYDSHIEYIKLSDDPLDDVEINSENVSRMDIDDETEIFKLKRDQLHPTLNPEVGKCFCCDDIVYRLLQHNCCDCNILLCSDCIVRDRYDYIPLEGGYVCLLCRVYHTDKNAYCHY